MKAYKYRAYPTKKQAIAIDKNIEQCRQLYNELLSLKKEAYEKNKKSLTRFDLIKKTKGKNKEAHSQVSQNVADRIDKAYKNFFARIKRGEKEKGFPRFKKYGVYSSITLPQITNSNKIGKKTYFPKIGWLNVKYHRPITGTPKTLTIKKAKSGKYFITASCDGATREKIKLGKDTIGIDLGLNHFVATSDGEFFDHPKPMKNISKKRKALARMFSKTKKRSNNRNKARIRLAKLDEKIADTRNDFGWKLCKTLIQKYKTVYIEDLNTRGMAQNHRLAGAITDVSWADFTNKLIYKAESAGGKVVKINPKNTSQMCSGCGAITKKTLATRTHNCPKCGLKTDRDTNAAQNILITGIGLEQPKYKPEGDEANTDGASLKQASPMKQEATQLVEW
jgi:putative transposase